MKVRRHDGVIEKQGKFMKLAANLWPGGFALGSVPSESQADVLAGCSGGKSVEHNLDFMTAANFAATWRS